MSPATEIAAFGQFSRSPRKKAAKIAALFFLAFLLSGLAATVYTTHRAASGPDDSVAQACALLDLPHETAADWDAIDAQGRLLFRTGAIRNTAADRAVFMAGVKLSSLASFEAQNLRAARPFPESGPFDAEQARSELVRACRR